MLDALDALDAFAGLATPSSPSIHTGKGGTYSDKYTAQSGEAHHALTVNPEAVQNLHGALEQLNKDERAIFMMVARSVVVAHMPVHRYRETKVKLDANGVALAASGRVTIDTGWRAGTTHTDADHDKGKKGKGSPESTPELPPVEQGMEGTVDAAKPIEKKTRAPKRLTEGDLVETMKNAWKFEDDPKERERLKEARGIGTPATRDQIIKGLRIQKLLEGRGRHIVPTTRGERLIEALEKACPELIAVALTARLEDTLDGVLRGESSAREAIERINSRASAMIDALKHHGRTLTEEEREALGAKERKDGPPSAKALEFADRIARDTNESIPKETRASAVKLSRWIDAHRRPPRRVRDHHRTRRWRSHGRCRTRRENRSRRTRTPMRRCCPHGSTKTRAAPSHLRRRSPPRRRPSRSRARSPIAPEPRSRAKRLRMPVHSRSGSTRTRTSRQNRRNAKPPGAPLRRRGTCERHPPCPPSEVERSSSLLGRRRLGGSTHLLEIVGERLAHRVELGLNGIANAHHLIEGIRVGPRSGDGAKTLEPFEHALDIALRTNAKLLRRNRVERAREVEGGKRMEIGRGLRRGLLYGL